MLGHRGAVTTSFAILVTVFLELIVKRLLDTFLDKFETGKLETYQWVTLITVVILICHTFVVFIKVISQDEYAAILDGTPKHNLLRLVTATLGIMVLLYVMADWFANGFGRFLIAAFALNIAFFVFDGVSATAIAAHFRRLRRSATDDHLFRSVCTWRYCDGLLILLFGLLTLTWISHKLAIFEIATVTLILFGAMTYLVPKILDLSVSENISYASSNNADNIVVTEDSVRHSPDGIMEPPKTTHNQSISNNTSHRRSSSDGALGLIAIFLWLGVLSQRQAKVGSDITDRQS